MYNQQRQQQQNSISDLLNNRAQRAQPRQAQTPQALGGVPQMNMPKPQGQPQPQGQSPQMPTGVQQPAARPGQAQAVRGRDGRMYRIVIDPTTGLQTFSPYQGG